MVNINSFEYIPTGENMTSMNKRREERYHLCEKVSYVLSDSSEDEVLQGLATNISKSGICLHLYHTLEAGASITLKSDLGNSCKRATLLWIDEMDSGLYKAGFGGC
jgi:hypothetical protein